MDSPEPRTLPQLFEAVLADPEAPLVSARPAPGDPFREMSAGELARAADGLAAGLAALEESRDPRVAIVLPNVPGWHICELALARLGAVSIPCHSYLAHAEIAWILVAAGATSIVLDDASRWEDIAAHGDGLPGVKVVVAMSNAGVARDRRVHSLAELCGGSPLDPGRFARVEPDDLATILYTSGTTGEPKGVRLSHANLLAGVALCRDRQPLEPGDVALSFLPLSHVLERVVTLVYMSSGVLVAYSSPAQIHVDLPEVRPHYMVGVPRVFEKIRSRALGSSAATRPGLRRKLVDRLTARGERRISSNGEEADRLTRFGDAVADRLMAAPIRKRTGGRLRKVMCGGAPLDPGLVSFFFGLNIPLYEGYGLSETSAILCLTPPERARGGSVGPPCSSTELRLVGGGGDEPGEIQVKGPQVFSEYESDPESTAAAFTADGWFRTGDLGSRDEDGFVRIRGRTKHVLLTSWGKMVTPGPMEARFTTSPLIEHAVVVGEGRPYLGLLVEPNTANLAEAARKHGISGLPAPDEADATTLAGVPGVLELLWEVIEAKQADLSKPERVRSFRVLPAPLTIEDGALTATMKIRRRVVLERYAELIEAVFAGEVPD